MRRRTRRRVQDTLRFNRSADCRTGAAANAATECGEKQDVLPLHTAFWGIREGKDGSKKGSERQAHHSASAGMAMSLRNP